MKLLLHLRLLLFLALCWAISHPAQAATPQAGQLTYTYVSTAANGEQTYRVQAQVFASCGGVALPGSLALEARQTCGGPARTATLPQLGQVVPLLPYCPRQLVQVQCPQPAGATTPEGFDAYTYEGTIALPPAAEWVLSVEAGLRPATANLLGTPMLRLEASLHSLLQPASGAPIVVTNSSARFSSTNLPLVLVFPQQESVISFTATDADRLNGRADSLVYTLESTRSACNALVSYAPYPGTCASAVDPRCPLRLITCQGFSASYSPALPIAVRADTIFENGSTRRPPCPTSIVTATVRPRFSFNQSSGSFVFTPIAYQPGATALGLNKYVVTAQVAEYRKLNGTYYLVGTVRREFMVGLDPTPLTGPGASLGPPRLSPGPVPLPGPPLPPYHKDTVDLVAYTCEYTRFTFTAFAPNNATLPPGVPPQPVQVFYPADVNTNLLQGGDIGQFVVSNDSTLTPRINLYLQPVSGTSSSPVYIPVRLDSYDCPIRGVSFTTLRIRVRRRPVPVQVQVNGQTGAAVAVCPGVTVPLAGLSLRPDSIRSYPLGQTNLQQYAYRWSVAPGYNAATAGLPAVTAAASINVTPTATTRYLLTVNPTRGFGPGICADTASVLVQLVGPAPTITRQGNTLISSYAAGNQWYLNGQPIAGATGQSYLATATGSYTVVATGSGTALPCVSPASVALVINALGSRPALAGTSISVAPNPTADGRVRVELMGYAQAATLGVYDLLGRQVLPGQTISAPNPAGTGRELDLSAQPAGVYLLQVQTKGGLDVRRIVRQ